MFRAFYKPANNSYEETFVDAENLEDLPSGSILVVELKKNGTRKVVSEKETLTQKEKTFHDIALRHTEFKHDGGDTPEMYAMRKTS